MHKKELVTAGRPAHEAKRCIIFLHGRGATAQDILSLGAHLDVDDFYQVAPQASNYTWYPYSFLVPPEKNEPWLSSALALLEGLVGDLNADGFNDNQIYFAGFSQGACLTLEFVARNTRRWGGVAAFTGGLIGDKLSVEHYRGDFQRTPIFIGTSDPDIHVPVSRVQETETVLDGLNANVRVIVYPNMGHTIAEDEIENANSFVFSGDQRL